MMMKTIRHHFNVVALYVGTTACLAGLGMFATGEMARPRTAAEKNIMAAATEKRDSGAYLTAREQALIAQDEKATADAARGMVVAALGLSVAAVACTREIAKRSRALRRDLGLDA